MIFGLLRPSVIEYLYKYVIQCYRAAVTFFPHRDEEDYAVSYDAFFEQELYRAPGRRSKKRETAMLDSFRDDIDRLVEPAGAKVFWERPLREARRG